jgi:hypothetical protein
MWWPGNVLSRVEDDFGWAQAMSICDSRHDTDSLSTLSSMQLFHAASKWNWATTHVFLIEEHSLWTMVLVVFRRFLIVGSTKGLFVMLSFSEWEKIDIGSSASFGGNVSSMLRHAKEQELDIIDNDLSTLGLSRDFDAIDINDRLAGTSSYDPEPKPEHLCAVITEAEVLSPLRLQFFYGFL